MIICEGTDMVGKTTLAKTIVTNGVFGAYHAAQALGIESIPIGPPVYRRLGLLPGNWNYYDDYVNRMQHNYVWDRFHLSERVYGKIARGASLLSDENLKKLEVDLSLVGTIIIIITAEDSVLEELHKERGDDLYDLDTIKKVNEGFIEIMANDGWTRKNYMGFHIKSLDDRPSDNIEFIDSVFTNWVKTLDEAIGGPHEE